jgi:hypothetical protein
MTLIGKREGNVNKDAGCATAAPEVWLAVAVGVQGGAGALI